MAFRTGTLNVPASGSALVYASATCVPATVVIENSGPGQLGLWDGNSGHASTPAAFPVVLNNFVGQLYLQNLTASAETVTYYVADIT